MNRFDRLTLYFVRCHAAIWHCLLPVVIRPPRPTVVGVGLTFYPSNLFFFYLSYVVWPATLRARRIELNQTLPHAWKWAKFENACPKFRISPPLKIWCHLAFLTSPQLNVDFDGEYVWNETWRRQSGNSVGNYKVSSVLSKILWILGHKCQKSDRSLYPLLFFIIARLHTRAMASSGSLNWQCIINHHLS